MSTYSLILKKILLILLFTFLFNNFSFANKIENISFHDFGFSKDRLNKINETFIKAIMNKEILGAELILSL